MVSDGQPAGKTSAHEGRDLLGIRETHALVILRHLDCGDARKVAAGLLQSSRVPRWPVKMPEPDQYLGIRPHPNLIRNAPDRTWFRGRRQRGSVRPASPTYACSGTSREALWPSRFSLATLATNVTTTCSKKAYQGQRFPGQSCRLQWLQRASHSLPTSAVRVFAPLWTRPREFGEPSRRCCARVRVFGDTAAL